MLSKNTIYFYGMTDSYYKDFAEVKELQLNRQRGHGVLIIDLNDLIVAIPLRSQLKPWMANQSHIFAYQIYTDSDNIKKLKGLDFSKLTIINEKHINTNTTYIFKDEFEKKFYTSNFKRLKLRVTNYINKYVDICQRIDKGQKLTKTILTPYRYSTLTSFHQILGINISEEMFIQELVKYGLRNPV